jgi:hypothetical protein
MGARVAWQQEADMHRERENPPEGKGFNGTPREERGSRRQKEEELQSVSRRVAGNLSSTRAELAAIAQTVKIAPIECLVCVCASMCSDILGSLSL